VLPATATVLLVDDDDTLRQEVAAGLVERFDRVLEAPSAEIALYLCGTHAVDVVATSALLPGMGADALCSELSDHAGPPVVAYRVPGEGSGRARWLDAGGADCIGGTEPELVAARCHSVVRRAHAAGAR